MRGAHPKTPNRIAMGNVHIFLFACCLILRGSAQPVKPILAYQDSLGQYSFGYSAPGSARSEIRTMDGETRGAYSYVDDAGVIQSVQYTADGKHGFRVAATNLPLVIHPAQSVQETKAAEEEEALQNEQKIGENNVFLKGLKSSDRNVMEGGEKVQLKSDKLEEGKIVEAQGIKETDGKGSSEETVKTIPQVNFEAKESQSDDSEKSKLSSSEKIFLLLKESNLPVLRIGQEYLQIYPAILQQPATIIETPLVPASTIPKSSQKTEEKIAEATSKESSAAAGVESKSQGQVKLIAHPEEVITPVHFFPAYSSVLRYDAPQAPRFVIYKNP